MIDFSAPLSGMEHASARLDRTAAALAGSRSSPSGDTVDLGSEMVSLLQARNDFAANANALNSEDQMTQSVLNIVA